MKSDKMLHIIYADLESLIKKVDESENNPENSSTAKAGEHIPCRYSMLTIWEFVHIENKHTLYCTKRFCDSLREHGKNIIDFEKKNCYC